VSADPILFEGASTEATIRESGEVVYKGEIPPEVEPLSCPGLFLRSSATTVRPETTTEDGAPATYLRDWHYTYIAASNEDLSAALKQLYGRLDSQSELR